MVTYCFQPGEVVAFCDQFRFLSRNVFAVQAGRYLRSRVSRTAAWRAAKENDRVSSSRRARRVSSRIQEARPFGWSGAPSFRPIASSLPRIFTAAPLGPFRTHSGQISPSSFSPSNSFIHRRFTAYRPPQQEHSLRCACRTPGSGRKKRIRNNLRT